MESRCFVSLSSTISRVPSFIVRDSSETAVRRKKTKRESTVSRRKTAVTRDGEKEQKEKAARARRVGKLSFAMNTTRKRAFSSAPGRGSMYGPHDHLRDDAGVVVVLLAGKK